jgi:SAM-dependent methyltransferase
VRSDLPPLDSVIKNYTRFVDEHRDRALYAFSDEFRPKIRMQVDKIAALLDCRPPAKVLDLACGTGSTTIELANRGYDVIGLDCTPAMLEVARQMSAREKVDVHWVQGDMRQMDYEDEMDYVLLRDVVFGICETEEEDRLILHNISRALRPGGRCLLEVYNKSFAQSRGIENRFAYDPVSDRFVVRPEARQDREGGDEISAVRLYSDEEWQRMLAAEDLSITARDGWNWQGDPAPPPWRADFIVAQKGRSPPR